MAAEMILHCMAWMSMSMGLLRVNICNCLEKQLLHGWHGVLLLIGKLWVGLSRHWADVLAVDALWAS